MESQTGGAALIRVKVVELGPQSVPASLALRAVSRSSLLRPLGISALLIHSTTCFILLSEKSLVKGYSGTEIAAQTLGGAI